MGIFERFNSRLRAVSTPSLDKADDEATGAVAGIPGVKKVDAKYPAFLFKQQLTAFVEKIYGFLRYGLAPPCLHKSSPLCLPIRD